MCIRYIKCRRKERMLNLAWVESLWKSSFDLWFEDLAGVWAANKRKMVLMVNFVCQFGLRDPEGTDETIISGYVCQSVSGGD